MRPLALDRTMDPLYKALPPKQTGKVALADGMQLYYELRGQDAAPNGRIVFLNGMQPQDATACGGVSV